MARMQAKFLDSDDPFPAMTLQTASGTTLTVPSDMIGDYGVVVFYRGHW